VKKHCLTLLLCAALLLSCFPAAAEEIEPSSEGSVLGESEVEVIYENETESLPEEPTDEPEENTEPEESTESELSVVSEEEPESSSERTVPSEDELPSQEEEKNEDENAETPEDEQQQITDEDSKEELSKPEQPLPEMYMLTFLDGLTGETISQTELAAEVSLEDYKFRPELPDGYSDDAYSFDGWYGSDGMTFDWDRTMPEEDLTLTAKWVIREFQVRVYPDLETLKENMEFLDSQTVEYGEYADEPFLPEYEDRVFDGWYCYSDGDSSPFDFEDDIREDTDIYAAWKPAELVVEVIHYIETADGYEEYESTPLEDQQIGAEFTAEPLDISGYLYNVQKSVASGQITMEDCIFELYYDRVIYPYEFRFLDADTGESLLESVGGTAPYQEEVQLEAPELPGYSVVNEDVCTLVIEADTENPEQNIGIFYYREDKATLSYQLTGDFEGAELLLEKEELPVFSGDAEGTALILQEGYLLDGWYSDEACMEPVPEEWIHGDSGLIPEKALYVYEDSEIHYADAVYYAKIIYGCADLVITASSAEEDCTQTFLYHVRGTDENTETIDLVAAAANGRVVIRDLPVGTYSVREITAWSWRYQAVEDELNITIIAGDETIAAFAHERTVDHWLSGIANFFRKWIAKND